MHFWVYLLRCADGSYYAGHTDKLEERLGEHQAGFGADWTARRRPVALVWCEALPSRDEAFAFERRLKGWTRAKKEALIARDWERVRQLAQSTEKLARPEQSAVKSKGVPTLRVGSALRLRTSCSAQDERHCRRDRAP